MIRLVDMSYVITAKLDSINASIDIHNKYSGMGNIYWLAVRSNNKKTINISSHLLLLD